MPKPTTPAVVIDMATMQELAPDPGEAAARRLDEVLHKYEETTGKVADLIGLCSQGILHQLMCLGPDRMQPNLHNPRTCTFQSRHGEIRLIPDPAIPDWRIILVEFVKHLDFPH
jgi:hypothetical protein